MGVLQDCQGKAMSLLEEIEMVQTLYNSAKTSFQALSSGQQVDLSSVGMTMHIGSANIPVPLPTDTNQLLDHLEGAVGLLGSELQRLWNELHATTSTAKDHIQAAFAAAATQAPPPTQAQQQPVPQQMVPPTSPPNIMPFPQVGAQPPANPPVSRQSLPGPVGTTPITTVPVQ